MATKITEIDKLKYWLDMEITILHIMLAIVLLQATSGVFVSIIISVYIFMQFLYLMSRGMYLASIAKDYLKIPKR